MPIDGWAEAPRTLGMVIEDEVHRLCIAHGVEPFRLDDRERERFKLSVQLWVDRSTDG